MTEAKGAPMWIEIPLGDDIKAKAFYNKARRRKQFSV